jgi:TRAP-type mannitol/chloroaromatic compound transport system substrate-binding protein
MNRADSGLGVHLQISVFHVHAHAMLITNNAAMQQHQPVVNLRTLAALPQHLAILFRGSLDPVRVLLSSTGGGC